MLLMTYDFYGGFGDGGHQSGFFHNAQHRGANDGFTVEAAINNAVNVSQNHHHSYDMTYDDANM